MLIGWASDCWQEAFARSCIWDRFLSISYIRGRLLLRNRSLSFELCVFPLFFAKRSYQKVCIDPGTILAFWEKGIWLVNYKSSLGL